MPHLLQERDVERALADDDLEAEPGRVTLRSAMRAQARDDQSLVGLRNLVEEHSRPLCLIPADDDRSGRISLEHQHTCALGNGLFGIRGVGVEALRSTAN